MFAEWEQLVVRLDMWHLMHHFARGVTIDGHHLYGLFMGRLSFAVFKWNAGDVARLTEAKRSQEGGEGDAPVKLSSREMAPHCPSQVPSSQNILATFTLMWSFLHLPRLLYAPQTLFRLLVVPHPSNRSPSNIKVHVRRPCFSFYAVLLYSFTKSGSRTGQFSTKL